MRARETWEAEARRRRRKSLLRKTPPSAKSSSIASSELVETRDKDVGRRASDLGRKEKSVEERQIELDKMVGEERRRLEQLAGLSAVEAKAELIRRMEEEAQADAANRLREIRESAKRNADREAKKNCGPGGTTHCRRSHRGGAVSAVSLPRTR